ncbi:hypothetical protein BJ912DRAFT_934059 [Pholiota molesta]|nr:hypothetical protein BJ912DRAFT_934059 [Pholiota molesta]
MIIASIASIDVRISPALVSYPLRNHEDYYDVFKELVVKNAENCHSLVLKSMGKEGDREEVLLSLCSNVRESNPDILNPATYKRATNWSLMNKRLVLFILIMRGVDTANANVTSAPTSAPMSSNSHSGLTIDNKIGLGIGIGFGVPSLLLAMLAIWVSIRAAKGHYESNRTPRHSTEQPINEIYITIVTSLYAVNALNSLIFAIIDMLLK